MSLIIKKNVATNEYTYENTLTHETGTLTQVLEKKTGINWIKLPPNEYNRKLLNPARVDETNEYIIDTIKTPASGEGGSVRTSSSIKWTEYLTDEEKLILKELRETAEKRAKIEYLKAQRDALIKQIEELE